MNDWKEYKLEDIASLIDYRGKTPTKTTSGVPLITAKIVKNGSIEKPTEFISHEDYPKWMTRGYPKVGDVVMTTEAPLGEVAQLKDNHVALAQRIITIRGHEGVLNNGYLKYFLQSENGQSRLKARETGTTVTVIKQSELKKVLIPLPDLRTQQSIAEILSSLADKIELNNNIRANLEALAQAIFKQWFIDFDFPDENGNPYKSSGGKMVESEIGLVPEGFKVIKLHEIVDIKHGFAFKSQFFSEIETENILLTPGNFKIGGGFKIDKYKYYSEMPPHDYVLNANDLIVTMTDLSKAGDTLGYPAIVPTIKNKKLLHNQRLGKVVFKTTIQPRFFIYETLKGLGYRTHVLGSATGSTVKHTAPSRILEFKTVLPSPKILDLYENTVCNSYQLQQNNFKENRELSLLSDILLPKLVSGEIQID